MKLRFHSKNSKVAAELSAAELSILLAFVLLVCVIVIFAPHGIGVLAVTNLVKAFRRH